MTSRSVLSGALLPGCLALTATVLAFPGGPAPAFTGGFDELTCASSGCHESFDLNAGRELGLGDVVISGLPQQYEPGKAYPTTVTVTHIEGRQQWGFQLAARVKATGAQAGELQSVDDYTQVLVENAIQYVEHTEEGIYTNTFEFTWVAPDETVGEVIMHAAGNAADGSVSPDGDYIYGTSVTLAPAGASMRLLPGHAPVWARGHE
jgi:hypothetical protein